MATRAAAQKPDQAGAVIWWQDSDEGTPIAELLRQVEAKGGAGNVRVEFHMDSRLLYVIPLGEGGVTLASHDGDDGINYSHNCPPECPEDDE